MMQSALVITWTIGLLGALALTVIVLKNVLNLVHILKGIVMLAQRICDAARGLSRHLDDAPRLRALAGPSRAFSATADSIAAPANAIAERLRAVERQRGEA